MLQGLFLKLRKCITAITGVPSLREVNDYMFLLWKAGIVEEYEQGETPGENTWKVHSRYKNMSQEESMKDFERRLQNIKN